MPQTRMFRDRVVSMEQTLEGGEKHLELLKGLCREAIPEFEYSGHLLDHERDLFVMELLGRDGRRKLVGWTRMVLFDAERIPVLLSDPRSLLREKIVAHLRAQASRPEIVVTFRHLEEGWIDSPEPRRDRRRRRRSRGEARGGAGERSAGRPRVAPPPPSGKLARPPRPGTVTPPAPPPQAAPSPEAGRPEGRRRRFRRRRRGRGTGGGGQPPPSSP
ncbi:MAG TPA: hypothetical protein VGK86_13680 [Thermoanaerobaculia bacterium]